MSYGAGAYDEFDHQPLAHIDSIDELVAYDWPDPDVLDAQAAVDAVRRADPGHRLFRVAWGGNPMETLTWMMGLEKLMMLLAIEPEIIVAGLERVVGFYEAVMRRVLEAGPGEFDAVFAADDLGGQSGPLISPGMYRELIQPYHRRIYAAAHDYVEFTLHHSDGSVFALLDDLLDAGVDALEATQTDCAAMDPAHLAAHYGERMSFVGGVSVQRLLPHGSVEEVEREVGRLIATLGAGGGLVAGPSHAIQAGTPPDNVFAMVRAITGRTVEQIAATPRETT
jgi:uroporphyrinogen decarboxylase